MFPFWWLLVKCYFEKFSVYELFGLCHAAFKGPASCHARSYDNLSLRYSFSSQQ